MEIWKKELSKLAKDFCVPLKVYNYIIAEAEKVTTTPKFYKNEKEAYLYDMAQRKIKAYIRAQLSV